MKIGFIQWLLMGVLLFSLAGCASATPAATGSPVPGQTPAGVSAPSPVYAVTPGAEVIFENVSRSGIVNRDERWRGTIDITGDITIIYPAMVTIDPGTTVRFAANSDDQASGGTEPLVSLNYRFDPKPAPNQISGIVIAGGTLRAVGSVDLPIKFTSSASNPRWGDWQSIEFRSQDASAHRSQMVLQNTIIEFGFWGVRVYGDARDADLVIKDNVIRYMVASGISLMNETTFPLKLTISGNSFSSCTHEGIYNGLNTSAIITGNVFWSNFNGIIVDGGSPVIRNNQFVSNRAGIAVVSEDSHPEIGDNIFRDNQITVTVKFEQDFIRRRSVIP